MPISNRDMVKLAILLSKTVHDLDFPKKGKFNIYASKTLQLVENLERKHPDAHLLSQIKVAITQARQDKIPLYSVTRDLLASVNRTVRFSEMAKGKPDNLLAPFFGVAAA
ncbi:MAG: hypothetical protein KTR18_04095 [Acidiferrobacterales bacterium]|nr:hypothetical protein [Acidiferrobacterales bacterium]